MSIQQVVNEFFPEASLLASGFYGSVYALSNTTVVKAVEDVLFFEVSKNKYDVADKLAAVWANKYNNLVVEFMDHIHIKDEQDDESIGHLFIMERIFPCVPTAFTMNELFEAIDVAEKQLKQLWKSGWAHCDLKRPDFVKKAYNYESNDILYNNIVLTEVDSKCVIRLIDIGNANIKKYDVDKEIKEHIAKDQADWEDFKLWLIDYPRQH